jgi:predicted RNase H-like nuclease (RuvC/YqgF family)
LEGALEVEKSANDEANKAIDRLTKQIRELEHSYEEERRNNKDINSKLDKVEKEYSSVKRQLTSEVENKKNVIGNLSKELEVHQKNFNELKEELSKVRGGFKMFGNFVLDDNVNSLFCVSNSFNDSHLSKSQEYNSQSF